MNIAPGINVFATQYGTVIDKPIIINSIALSNKKFYTGNNTEVDTYITSKIKEYVFKIVHVFSQGSESMNLSRLKNIERLDYFENLPYNWNENQAERFDKVLIDTCKAIINMLPLQPEVFPTGVNSIQFEYEKQNGDYFEFNVFEDRIVIFKIIEDEEVEEQLDINQKNKLQKMVRDFLYD